MADETNTQTTQQTEAQQQTQTGSAPAFDYEKLANILDGRQKANEDSVLKGYFKQQGITGEEAVQAIAAFKAQKAASTPDPAALQSQVNAAQSQALRTAMENKALLMAAELGVELKTVPYLMKLADLNGVAAEGKVDEDKLKEAIGKVLEDVPQLKKQTEAASSGIRVGADTGSATGWSSTTLEEKLRAAAGLKTR